MLIKFDEIHPQELENFKGGEKSFNVKMFTDENKYMITTVVNTRQVPEFMNILKKHPDNFVYYSDVTGVKGNFRRYRDDVAK